MHNNSAKKVAKIICAVRILKIFHDSMWRIRYTVCKCLDQPRLSEIYLAHSPIFCERKKGEVMFRPVGFFLSLSVPFCNSSRGDGGNGPNTPYTLCLDFFNNASRNFIRTYRTCLPTSLEHASYAYPSVLETGLLLALETLGVKGPQSALLEQEKISAKLAHLESWIWSYKLFPSVDLELSSTHTSTYLHADALPWGMPESPENIAFLTFFLLPFLKCTPHAYVEKRHFLCKACNQLFIAVQKFFLHFF